MLSAVAVKSALDELIAGAERATGHKVTVAYATAGVLRDRIKAGETFDMVILPRPFGPVGGTGRNRTRQRKRLRALVGFCRRTRRRAKA